MKKAYFTFGQCHTHRVLGVTFDKDIVVEIEAETPRIVMVGLFGNKWAFEYDKPPNMDYFPRGIIKIDGNGIKTREF